MTFAVLQIRPNPLYRRAAFELGLRAIGYADIREYRCRRNWPSGPDDLLVLWNMHAGPDEKYAAEWERRGGTVIVCENGYLQRVDKTMYAISAHGHNGSGWFPIGDDAKARFERLGIEIKPMREPTQGGVIVVRGQRGIGSAAMASPRNWHDKHAKMLRARGARVQVVPHPGDKGKLEADLAALANANALHIWSSAMGVRALCEGVPVVYHAPRWICAGWQLGGREWALHQMACGQWHHEEIATGEPFARLRDSGWGRNIDGGRVKAPSKEIAA